MALGRIKVRLMKNSDMPGNLTNFLVENRKRECSGEARAAVEDKDEPLSDGVLLKTLEEPFESEGRSRRIARLHEKVLAGTYHIPAIELAERMIDGDIF
jgi:hypothetical protein